MSCWAKYQSMFRVKQRWWKAQCSCQQFWGLWPPYNEALSSWRLPSSQVAHIVFMSREKFKGYRSYSLLHRREVSGGIHKRWIQKEQKRLISRLLVPILCQAQETLDPTTPTMQLDSIFHYHFPAGRADTLFKSCTSFCSAGFRPFHQGLADGAIGGHLH